MVANLEVVVEKLDGLIMLEKSKGINLNAEEIYNINKIITPLIKKGQTTNHLFINQPDILNFSKSSFYKYIHFGIFEFGSLDLLHFLSFCL